MKIAIVASQFNDELVEKLLDGAHQQLIEREIKPSEIKVVRVPGAVEIPLAAQELALQKIYDAVICLGAIVQGETDHYDYVCQQVSYGCQKVALEQNLPIIFGILTVQNWQQALDRLGGIHGHKGKEAADTAIDMIHALQHCRF